MPVDLKNPGGKEILLFGGGALGLALIYFALNKSKTSAAPSSTPATGGGLGSTGTPGPQFQVFMPGGQSPTGNAFTDSLFTTPATPPPIGPVTGIAGQPPPQFPHFRPRISSFVPVQHVQQGAEDILGSGATTTSTSASLTPSTTTTVTTTNLAGGWQGGSLFNSPVNPVAWANSVLDALGAPKTSANQQSLVAWALHEAGGGAYNPLNTTLGSNYPAFNSIGVRNYPNWQVGAQETAATLRLHWYPNILAGLMSGKGIPANAGSELHTWSGAGYSSISGYWQQAGGIVAAYVKAQQAALAKARAAAATKAATAKQVQGLFPTVKPVANRRPAPKPKARGLTPSFGKIVLGFQEAWRKAFPPRPTPSRKPAYRPTPRRGPGHPLLH